MNDLFKKLNLLVKSGINDVLGDDTARRAVDPRQLGKDLSKEVDMLRSRVNEAINHEDSLQQQVESLAIQVENLDKAADEAVKQGKELEAKHILSQMQFAQQRLSIAQSDLQSHQVVTADLIQRVNLLDTVVSEARSQQTDDARQENSPAGSIQDAMQDRMNTLSDMLKSAREKVAASLPAVGATQSKDDVDEAQSSERLSKPAEDQHPDTGAEGESNEDDFEVRLQRLSKPKKP